MFDIMKHVNANSTVESERPDVERGLARFKNDTGVDFLDLLSDKQLRAKFLVSQNDHQDTDEDERNNQDVFESLQKNLLREDK